MFGLIHARTQITINLQPTPRRSLREGYLVLGALFNFYSPLRPPWNAIMWASCPPIEAVQTAWWLVPIRNRLLYAGIAVSTQFFRKFIRPFAS